jgi:hypothetical protein
MTSPAADRREGPDREPCSNCDGTGTVKLFWMECDPRREAKCFYCNGTGQGRRLPGELARWTATTNKGDSNG